MKRSAAIRQVVRYGMIGFVANATAYSTYLLLTELALSPRTAMTWVYLVAALVGYWGNRSLTFEFRGSRVSSGARYVLAHFVGYVFNWILLTGLVDWFGLPHQLAQALAIVIVAIVLFILYRTYVFVAPSQRRDSSEFEAER